MYDIIFNAFLCREFVEKNFNFFMTEVPII